MDYGVIFSYNGVWFIGICMLSYFFGMITAWNKKFAMGLLIIAGIIISIMIIYAVTMIPLSTENHPWYYHIGAFCGGGVSTITYKFGKEKFHDWMKGD